MSGDTEKMKEDVLKNPKHVLVCIQFLMLQGKPIFEAYKEFCQAFGDDVMEYNDFDFWWYRFLNGEFYLDYDRSKEPKKRELGDMPIKIFEKIVGKLKYEERYALLNVSKRIRNVMENSNLLISNLSLNINQNKIKVSLNGRDVEFKSSRGRRMTHVLVDDVKKQVNGNYLIVALKHLTRILKNPRLRFYTFHVDFNRMHARASQCCKAIKETFQSIPHQIHVENLELKMFCEKQLLTILPYLKPGVLETIKICTEDPYWCRTKQFIDLEQFRQAKSFTSNEFAFNANIDKLFHFEYIDIMMEKIKEEHLIRFKNGFIASPVFKHCRLMLEVLPGVPENVNVLRQVRAAFNGKTFAIPGSRDSIRVRVDPFEVSIDRVSNR